MFLCSVWRVAVVFDVKQKWPYKPTYENVEEDCAVHVCMKGKGSVNKKWKEEKKSKAFAGRFWRKKKSHQHIHLEHRAKGACVALTIAHTVPEVPLYRDQRNEQVRIKRTPCSPPTSSHRFKTIMKLSQLLFIALVQRQTAQPDPAGLRPQEVHQATNQRVLLNFLPFSQPGFSVKVHPTHYWAYWF